MGEIRRAAIAALKTRFADFSTPLPDDVASLEIDLLLEATGSMSRVDLIVRRDTEMDPKDVSKFYELLNRRLEFEPVAYLLGKKEFYSREFIVTPAVLIPRPETEMVVDRAVEFLEARLEAGHEVRCVDVGVGSGAILLSIVSELRERLSDTAISKGEWIGVDCSPEAISVAQRNSVALGLSKNVRFIEGDLLTPLDDVPTVQWECIVSNPPYIPNDTRLAPDIERYEPALALRGGSDGLDVYRRLVPKATNRIAGGGILILEIGDNQVHAIESLISPRCDFASRCFRDLAGFERVLEIVHSRGSEGPS